MKTLNYVDEVTFKSESVEIDDEQYNIAIEIFKNFGNYGQMIVGSDKKSLVFSINKGLNNIDKEIGSNLYTVTIKKI